MEQSQITKKQHFIPNFLIKRWKNEENNILILSDKGEKNIVAFSNNKKFFAKDFLYEIENGVEINLIENKLKKIEEKYAKLTTKIIDAVNKGVILKEMGVSENEMALIELFSVIQMFRNYDYWNLVKDERINFINRINDLIDNYYIYTRMSKEQKELLNNELLTKMKNIEKSANSLSFDKYEYQMHNLYRDPKYFLIHALHFTYYYTVMPFITNTLPLSCLGQYKVSENNDQNYFYLTPISPGVAILKNPKHFSDDEILKLFIKKFAPGPKCEESCVEMMLLELMTVSKFAVASPKLINRNFEEDWTKIKKVNVAIKIPDNPKKENKTIINKKTLNKKS